jgi:hypothetical protein
MSTNLSFFERTATKQPRTTMMMTGRSEASWFSLLLLASILVVAVQSLSAVSPVDRSAAAAASQQRRQESLNAGRDALLSLNLNLDALAQGEHAAQAEALYTKISVLHQEGYYDVQPDTVSFNSVLKAHRNDPIRALEFWENNVTVRKNIRSYNAFFTALANAGLAQDASTLLLQMQMLNAAVRPDLISWNTVLLAYANCAAAASSPGSTSDNGETEEESAAVTAEKLLQTMIQAHNANGTNPSPRRGRRKGEVREKIVLETTEVEEEAKAEEDADENNQERKNARVHNKDDNNRVVPLISLRDPHYRPPFPNEVSVATVMMAWSRHDNAIMGAKMAEHWLYRHYDLLGRLPSPHAYAVTLQAYGRCQDNPDFAVRKVLDILHYMEATDLAASTYNKVYHIALSILAQLRGMEAAKQVFQRMEKPDVPIYTRMIQLWGNHAKTLRYHHGSGISSGRRSAQANQCLMEILVLFRQMKKDPLALPNSISYTTTINAIAETQLPNSGEIATTILRKMKQPTEEHYHAALKAIAHSNHPGKTIQAWELLDEMMTQRHFPPNRIAYNAILQAARTGYGPDETRSQNLRIGWQAFLALHELLPHDANAVTSVTYQRCLRMIDTQDRHRQPDSIAMAKEVLEKCCANGCLNRHVLRAARLLFTATHQQELADLLRLPVLPDDDDDDIVAGLPEEWTQHALM